MTDVLKVLALALRLLGLLMFVPIALFLITAVAQFVDGAGEYPLVRHAIRLTRPATRTVQQQFPIRVKGYDVTPWLLVVAALVLRGVCRSSGERLDSYAGYLAHKRSLRRYRARLPAATVAAVLNPVEAKLEAVREASKKDRAALLKEFIEAKKRLEEVQRDLVEKVDAGSVEGLKVRTELSVEYTVRKKDEAHPPPTNNTAQGG